MNGSTIQEKRIGDIAHKQVMAALREILSDPDRGLELRAGFVSRVKKSMRSKEAGKVKNLEEVLANRAA
ncbi:hypothetical protein A3G55_03420 [Candidatus Giovannonibacteria bacterium RIFCSPLOWO2_12_FULL_44_25]|uniref:Uncharacterized protein n=1 Tax=Candidatus Giovannonibacteria bacterium RIFCSPHIGHO2_02_FULL_45_40 TaxID=1798337 RepID=A0A1F5WBM6_9BACT|nr:MAG: hypothetical protein A2120_01890 [Candidatus Giovannonibacteria bacterium GWA2_45_15]OGF60112.1 MAG: hypothetical protein A2W40_00755 [Candidatus Giovannonibacteria bacterium RIFCSPHIGHO2_01_45_12]OGF60839.1 MAG: hypothetical protein A2656_03095 [Candidatus Giovannonibacteria bacterium RIFCSPHIGHO2_01_FULL_44_100]OGF73034.1 MAG: hypothetical protein A3C05_04595 [Candidatus Giovannonibacteria bacterium RIFCSPHIGHO2_02_FULL_45_40]OGF93004.1 MAG: hypothetical protein A3G55_03420 [Candidatu